MRIGQSVIIQFQPTDNQPVEIGPAVPDQFTVKDFQISPYKLLNYYPLHTSSSCRLTAEIQALAGDNLIFRNFTQNQVYEYSY